MTSTNLKILSIVRKNLKDNNPNTTNVCNQKRKREDTASGYIPEDNYSFLPELKDRDDVDVKDFEEELEDIWMDEEHILNERTLPEASLYIDDMFDTAILEMACLPDSSESEHQLDDSQGVEEAPFMSEDIVDY
jgi:hypothetical protein